MRAIRHLPFATFFLAWLGTCAPATEEVSSTSFVPGTGGVGKGLHGPLGMRGTTERLIQRSDEDLDQVAVTRDRNDTTGANVYLYGVRWPPYRVEWEFERPPPNGTLVHVWLENNDTSLHEEQIWLATLQPWITTFETGQRPPALGSQQGWWRIRLTTDRDGSHILGHSEAFDFERHLFNPPKGRTVAFVAILVVICGVVVGGPTLMHYRDKREKEEQWRERALHRPEGQDEDGDTVPLSPVRSDGYAPLALEDCSV